jgi:DNA-binding SARP family transcriptional activator
MADKSRVLKIFAFGPPEVRLGEHLVTFPTRKTLAMLIYLANEPVLYSRDHLATMFWPEATPERSYASLRNTLNHLQIALRQASDLVKTDYLTVTRNSLGLNSDAEIEFDLQIVQRAYELARSDRSNRKSGEGSARVPLLQSAASCQRGDFLVGFSLGDAPEFDDWVGIQREVWHRRLGLILDRLSEIQFAQGEFAGATETVAQWVALDRLNEIAYRRKMRAHFAAGERGQALETYNTCLFALEAALGIKPEPDTVALAERIRSQPTPTHSHQRSSASRLNPPNTSGAFLGSLFTGRITEHQSLENSYWLAATGRPQFVVLSGEAGIGKTHLADKFIAWASMQGVELLRGSAYESSSRLPFHPLVEALRLRFKHKNETQDLLGDVRLSPLVQLLPELREHDPDLPSPDLAETHPEEKVSQAGFYESIIQYTFALSKQAPIVMFLDDLQWTDSATLDLLQYAIRRWRELAAPVLLLVSLRSEALHSVIQPQQIGSPPDLSVWFSRIERELKPVIIELEPLGEQETVQLVLSILSPPVVDFAQWLYSETRGQPFYLMETLKDLLERGVLSPKRKAEGEWSFALDVMHDLGQAVRVPSTVHAVISSRLNRLSPNAFSLLAAGAVLEQPITFKHLCAVSNVTEDLALPAIDELISARLLLEPEQTVTASAYTFTNDMLRDVVYTEAGDARRRLFHQRALEVLEAAGASAAVLAHHALAAGLDQDIFRLSMDAGRESLRISAVKEAIVHFELALRFVQEATYQEMPDETNLRDLYYQLGRAYKLSGQDEKALKMEAELNRLG